MIEAIVKSTHSKFIFEDATEEEIVRFERLLVEKFTVTDSSLTHTTLVKRGFATDQYCFYMQDKRIIPSGLIPFVKIYCKRNGWDLKVTDMRPKILPTAEFVSALKNRKVRLGSAILRDYQMDAIEAAIKYRTGILVDSVGSGKTLLLSGLCRAYENHKIICVFNQVGLIDQTYKDMIERFGFSEEEVGVVGAGGKDDGCNITLLSAASYFNLSHIFPETGVIIMDEVHSTGRTATAEKIIYSCQNAGVKIGLTATGDHLDDEKQQMQLYANVGPILYKATFKERMDEGVIAKATVKMHRVPQRNNINVVGSWNDTYHWVKVKDKKQEAALIKDGYEIVKEKGELLGRKFLSYGDESILYIHNESMNELVAKVAMENNRCLILYSKIKHGEILRDLIPKSMLIHGGSSLQDRRKAKEFLQKNEKSVVIASSMWDVGENIPEIENLVIASPHVSSVRIVQKAGRGVRKAESIGKMSVTIHNFFVADNKISVKQGNRLIKVYKEIMSLPVQWV